MDPFNSLLLRHGKTLRKLYLDTAGHLISVTFKDGIVNVSSLKLEIPTTRLSMISTSRSFPQDRYSPGATPRNGQVRDAFINSALNSNVARNFFQCISGGKSINS